MPLFSINPDTDNIEPLITAINAATEPPLSDGKDVVLYLPDPKQVSSPIVKKALKTMDITLPPMERISDPVFKFEWNGVNVFITHSGTKREFKSASNIIGAWGGKRIRALLEASNKEANCILVNWLKDKQYFPDESEDEQWLEANNAQEIPLEVSI